MAAPDLATLQREFLAYLTANEPNIAATIVETATVSAATRLRIYQHAYGARLTDALQDNFPALFALLGDDGFAELARLYIHYYPSQHFSLRYFGEQLTTLLTNYAPYRERPYLAEMAAFEWTVWAAFDAADTPVITLADLQAIPPEHWTELGFVLHPSCHLLSLHWDIPLTWQALQHDPQAPFHPPTHSETATVWLVWRQELRTYFRSLSTDEAWALTQIQQGRQHRFAQLCEGLCAWVNPEQAPPRVAKLLQTWLADGLIHSVIACATAKPKPLIA